MPFAGAQAEGDAEGAVGSRRRTRGTVVAGEGNQTASDDLPKCPQTQSGNYRGYWPYADLLTWFRFSGRCAGFVYVEKSKQSDPTLAWPQNNNESQANVNRIPCVRARPMS